MADNVFRVNLNDLSISIEGIQAGDSWHNLHLTTEGVTINEETKLVGKGNFAVVEAAAS